MSLLKRIIGKFRRQPKVDPIAKAHNGAALRPGMRVRLAFGGAGIHKVSKIIQDGQIEIEYSDGVKEPSFSDLWNPVRRRRH